MGRLNEETSVSLGLIISVVAAFGAVLGVAVTAIWWSATIQADVTQLKTSTEKFVGDHETRIRAGEARDADFDTRMRLAESKLAKSP